MSSKGPVTLVFKPILSWSFVLLSRAVRFNWIAKHGTMARK